MYNDGGVMLSIFLSEDSILQKKSKRVARIDDSVRTLAKSMIDTMYNANGIGLSAVQIGILKQIIIVDHHSNPIVMINPLITKMSKEEIEMEEGCLSCPNIVKKITRPENIEVKYRDLKGKPHFEFYDGLTARIIQHEILHLYGELIV
jgi:peptide deformylase